MARLLSQWQRSIMNAASRSHWCWPGRMAENLKLTRWRMCVRPHHCVAADWAYATPAGFGGKRSISFVMRECGSSRSRGECGFLWAFDCVIFATAIEFDSEFKISIKKTSQIQTELRGFLYERCSIILLLLHGDVLGAEVHLFLREVGKRDNDSWKNKYTLMCRDDN